MVRSDKYDCVGLFAIYMLAEAAVFEIRCSSNWVTSKGNVCSVTKSSDFIFIYLIKNSSYCRNGVMENFSGFETVTFSRPMPTRGLGMQIRRLWIQFHQHLTFKKKIAMQDNYES